MPSLTVLRVLTGTLLCSAAAAAAVDFTTYSLARVRTDLSVFPTPPCSAADVACAEQWGALSSLAALGGLRFGTGSASLFNSALRARAGTNGFGSAVGVASLTDTINLVGSSTEPVELWMDVFGQLSGPGAPGLIANAAVSATLCVGFVDVRGLPGCGGPGGVGSASGTFITRYQSSFNGTVVSSVSFNNDGLPVVASGFTLSEQEGLLKLSIDTGLVSSVSFTAILQASVGRNFASGLTEADAFQSAHLWLKLPPGVRATTASGQNIPSPVPEPATWLSLLAGLAALGIRRLRPPARSNAPPRARSG